MGKAVREPVRSRSRTSRAVMVVVMLLGLLVLQSGCGCNVTVPYKVPLPPRSASPEEVLLTYFRALNARDKATVRALLVPADADTMYMELDNPTGPYQNWISITDLELDGPHPYGDCKPGETCTEFYASFDLRVCEFFTEGDGGWGESYDLKRVDGRWLVGGHGQG